MTNKEIKIANEKMEIKMRMRDKNPYMSTLWLYFDGQALGIETLMNELGYEWVGQEFLKMAYCHDKTKEC